MLGGQSTSNSANGATSMSVRESCVPSYRSWMSPVSRLLSKVIVAEIRRLRSLTPSGGMMSVIDLSPTAARKVLRLSPKYCSG